jgi:hypothetical protein
MTTTLATVGDLHVNSTVGLLPYSVNLDDGGTYRASKGQRWLWRCWLDFWDSIPKGEVWTVLNGDLVDVNGKYNTAQLISLNDSDVMKMAIKVLEPALEKSKLVFVVRGTAAHTGLSGYMEEKIGYDIGAEKCGDNYSWWELPLECEGVLYDIRHHGSLGYKEWTRPNSLNSRAVEITLAYANNRVPNVAIQSHKHRFSTSSDEYPVKVFALPAWQLFSEYVHRLGTVMPADIGGVYFINESGDYDAIVKRYKPERTRTWRKSSPQKT